MTHLAVAITVASLDQALAAAARAAEHGADLVEFRIDTFVDSPPAITQLVTRSSLPCIVTCRPTWEGGAYAGDDEHRLRLFEHACAGPRRPAYLDVELAAYERSDELRVGIDALVDHPGQPAGAVTPALILSSHDFQGRPRDLQQRVAAMASAPACRVIKVAWRARSLRDNLEAFELILQHPKPMIALCMDEAGLPSRVLAKKFGALLTFAALQHGAGTASGQPTVDDLKRLYRWDAIDADTRVFGVIGWPVGHSMSPHIHNAGFHHVGFNGVYLPMPVPPEYEHFKATVSTWLAMDSLHFRGASVTIPHKGNLLRFVAEHAGEIEPLAQRIGAANTLHVREDGSLFACNTDYAAALDAVCDSMGITREQLQGVRVAVIGAGGAARAIVAGFAHYGATVVVHNRTFEKARALAERFDGQTGKVVPAQLEALRDSGCRVYINCTSVGMFPNVDETPMPKGPTQGWTRGTVVFDTVYNPAQTRLLIEAAGAGCKTIAGTEMFTRQAAGQFKLFTGRDAPRDVFTRVIEERLQS